MSISVPSAPATTSIASSFTELNLSETILRALADEGYTTPTPIQAQAIPHIIEGRDVLGCAQTGTGKTAAFALPILHRLLTAPLDTSYRGGKRARALILSPTRELAEQIAESFKTYGKNTGLSGCVIYGGVSQRPQEAALRRGVDIIVATPGRLIDLTEQGLIDYSGIETFILDEADRMLDMGFIRPINQIAAQITTQAKGSGKPRQTLLFSATMPREIQHLAHALLKDPVKITVAPRVETTALIEQSVYHVPQSSKQSLLDALVSSPEVTRAVVFTRTKHGAERVRQKLEQAGITAIAIHGNKNQNQRQRSLESFRSGRHRVLVATDVAARGLDVDGISHVFNFDLPIEPEAYVHRIGRTGRAGASGIAVAFCDPAERGLLRAIEGTTKTRIRVVEEMPAAFKITPRTHSASASDHAPHRDPFAHRDHTHGHAAGHHTGNQGGSRGHSRPSYSSAKSNDPRPEGGRPTSSSNPRPVSRGWSAAHPQQTTRQAAPRQEGVRPLGPKPASARAGGKNTGKSNAKRTFR